MKKKRNYTRKPTLEAPKSKSVKEASSIIPQTDVLEASVKEFTFKDLPLSLRRLVERDIAYRKRLGLPDDSKERKEKAVKYFRGDRPR